MDLFLQGFLLQASLIFALGAQNLFVLDSGLKRRHPALVASVCSICDIVLVFLGVLGAASVFLKFPFLKIAFGCLGVGFLAFYGFQKLKSAMRLELTLDNSQPTVPKSVRRTILTALGFSLLNPHAILDTIVLVGGYATKFPGLFERFWFGAGAASCSTVWFFGLAFLSSALSSVLKSPRAMQGVNAVSGLLLLGIAWKLAKDVIAWM